MNGSPLRELIAKATESKYRGIDNLKVAKKGKNYYLIMEGDDGGQIYLTCPVRLIQCKESTLKKLLEIIDAYQWPGNSNDMRRIIYEPKDNGSIAGGMGGGVLLENLWVHEEIKFPQNLIKKIIIDGMDAKILELEKTIESRSVK